MKPFPLLKKTAVGTATLFIAVNDLIPTLASLPQSYRILRSEQAQKDGQIVLTVVSSDVSGHNSQLQIEVEDAGSTRTVRLVPLSVE